MTRTNQIHKLVYSGETRSLLASTLTNAVYGMGTTANRGTVGYLLGGQGQSDPYYPSLLERLTFSTDTNSAVSYYSLIHGNRYANHCPTYDKNMCLIFTSYDISDSHFISAFYFSTETSYVTSVQQNSPNPQQFGNLEDSGAY